MVQFDYITEETKQRLCSLLQSFVTPERYAKFLEVLKNRTRHLTIVLEDIYQPHNASAVLRSCDCFGIQDVHIIENRNKYEINPDVALGSSKWLNLFRYSDPGENTVSCLELLKQRGYRLVATTPQKNGLTPDTLPLEQKTALLFGTELAGLTQAALDLADDFINIPMVGFTESLNISVSAAIFLQNLSHRLRISSIPWQLNRAEQDEIIITWLLKSINKSEVIVQEFLKNETERKSVE
ncbi:MAG: RNA methyltransferase [Bacteroidales bacterium]|jgi:tRNA (guanosine-2'-O-)-methyltransferase|nr:RNA methyltransferase [Bacteroidales bacterium]